MKICSLCKKEKDLTEFSKNVSRKSGLCERCKTCSSSITKAWYKDNKVRHNLWRENNIDLCKTHHKKSNLKINFGLTIEDYNAILICQDYKCLICDKTPEENGRALPVDHNHETGDIRGLLCDCCNRGIGLLKDNPETLRKAAKYLEKYISDEDAINKEKAKGKVCPECGEALEYKRESGCVVELCSSCTYSNSKCG